VNFILVGACDGTHDKTIDKLFLPNPHWRGAFVEAISYNVHDLKELFSNNSALDRSHIIHAAATNTCMNKTITVQRPLFEEKNKSIAHWMRRQIGGIAAKNHLLPIEARKDRRNWATEEVRCVTGGDILYEWASVLYNEKMALKKKLRPHILKVDAEGHDYEVLLSFLSEDVSDSQLPLLIDFEAKSLGDQYERTLELLRSRCIQLTTIL
jgi:hypothetical protein